MSCSKMLKNIFIASNVVVFVSATIKHGEYDVAQEVDGFVEDLHFTNVVVDGIAGDDEIKPLVKYNQANFKPEFFEQAEKLKIPMWKTKSCLTRWCPYSGKSGYLQIDLKHADFTVVWMPRDVSETEISSKRNFNSRNEAVQIKFCDLNLTELMEQDHAPHAGSFDITLNDTDFNFVKKSKSESRLRRSFAAKDSASENFKANTRLTNAQEVIRHFRQWSQTGGARAEQEQVQAATTTVPNTSASPGQATTIANAAALMRSISHHTPVRNSQHSDSDDNSSEGSSSNGSQDSLSEGSDDSASTHGSPRGARPTLNTPSSNPGNAGASGSTTLFGGAAALAGAEPSADTSVASDLLEAVLPASEEVARAENAARDFKASAILAATERLSAITTQNIEKSQELGQSFSSLSNSEIRQSIKEIIIDAVMNFIESSPLVNDISVVNVLTRDLRMNINGAVGTDFATGADSRFQTEFSLNGSGGLAWADSLADEITSPLNREEENIPVLEAVNAFKAECIAAYKSVLESDEQAKILAAKAFSARALNAAIEALKVKSGGENMVNFGRENRGEIGEAKWIDHAISFFETYLENVFAENETPNMGALAYFGREHREILDGEMDINDTDADDLIVTDSDWKDNHHGLKANWATEISRDFFSEERRSSVLENAAEKVEELHTCYTEARTAFEDFQRSRGDRDRAEFIAFVENAKDSAYKQLQSKAGAVLDATAASATATDEDRAALLQQRQQMIKFGKCVSELSESADEVTYTANAARILNSFLLHHFSEESVTREISEPVLYLIHEALGNTREEDGIEASANLEWNGNTKVDFATHLAEHLTRDAVDAILIMYRNARTAYTEDMARIAKETERMRRAEEIRVAAAQFVEGVLQKAIRDVENHHSLQEEISGFVRNVHGPRYSQRVAVTEVLRQRITNDFWHRKSTECVGYFGIRDPDVFKAVFNVDEIDALNLRSLQIWAATIVTQKLDVLTDDVVADLCAVSFANCDARVVETPQTHALRGARNNARRANTARLAKQRRSQQLRASRIAQRENEIRSLNSGRSSSQFLKRTHAGAGTRSASRPTAMRSTTASAVAETPVFITTPIIGSKVVGTESLSQSGYYYPSSFNHYPIGSKVVGAETASISTGGSAPLSITAGGAAAGQRVEHS